MKSQTRAWFILTVMLLFWGTLPVSPFSYFAEMIRELSGYLIMHPFMPAVWQSVLTYIVFMLLLSVLLLVGRTRNRIYIAGFCALAEMAHHLVLCIRTGKVYPVSLAIAIGLALALLFILIRSKSPALWLSDAFILSLSVWLIYDGAVYAISRLPGQPLSGLSGLIKVPASSVLPGFDGVFGLPMAVWAIVPTVLAIVPIVLFGKGRAKG